MSDTNERSVASSGSVDAPVAWGAVWPEDGTGIHCDWVYSCKDEAAHAAKNGAFIDGRRGVGTAVPLYRSLALTDSEREAVRFCTTAALPEAEKLGGVAGELCRMHAATLRGLLERLK